MAGDEHVFPAVVDKRLVGEAAVEGDVGRHVSRPILIAVRERLVPAHRPMLRQAEPMVKSLPVSKALVQSRKLIKNCALGCNQTSTYRVQALANHSEN